MDSWPNKPETSTMKANWNCNIFIVKHKQVILSFFKHNFMSEICENGDGI